MNVFRRLSIGALSSLAVLTSAFFLSNGSSNMEVHAEEAETASYTKVKADVSQFKETQLDPNCTTTFKINETDESITTNGSWENHFVSTNQFDTTTGSYYLKTHVYGALEDYSDGLVGFNVYYDYANFLNFYLHWTTDAAVGVRGSIAEAVFLTHVNGEHNQAYASAKLPDGEFELRTTFTDCWTDFGGWMIGTDRDNCVQKNLRTEGSTILVNKGFDMTVYVDRTTYKDRLVDVMQMRVDAFAKDGVTPVSYFTPKYAVDAFTCPKGEGESSFAQIKPQIGFWNNAMGDVTYSSIEFGHKPYKEQSTVTFKTVGSEPAKAVIDNDTHTIAYENNNFNAGFYLPENVTLTSPRVEFKAHLKGNIGDVKDATVGYVFYYDENNYLLLFLEWNGTAGTIDGFHVLATVGGATKQVYQGATNPWDDPAVDSTKTGFSTVDEFKTLWSDYGGFVTDCEYPCYRDANLYKFRSEGAITLEAGFDMGVIRRRTVYLSRTIDEYQMCITAAGTDGKTHTWYTPLWCMDAFTYPKGSTEASALKDIVPAIGLYSYKAGEVTFSDLSLNGATLVPKDMSSLVFGSHTEGDWTFWGSDKGSNWVLSEGTLTETWNEAELPIDSHEGEVVSLKKNESPSPYMSATFVLSEIKSNLNYIGIYPYYKDENNYLFACFEVEVNGEEKQATFNVSGKLKGENLGGVSSLLSVPVSYDNLVQGLFLEIGLDGDEVDFYFDQDVRPTYSFVFDRQEFGSRDLESASTGFTFYNASGSLKNINLASDERVNAYTPTESDIPTIYMFGTKSTSGYAGYSFTLPTFVAFNYLHEAIDVEISIYTDDGTLVKKLDKDVFEFTVDEIGTYEVRVNATDEWGHSAEQISYKVNFVKYLAPTEGESKSVLWQTIVVLSFFGGILLITAFCAVILVRKNRKEALKAAELNRKNQEKNIRDMEDE